MAPRPAKHKTKAAYKKELEAEKDNHGEKGKAPRRAELRRKRVKAGLTGKDGYATGKGDTHIDHVSPAKGKPGGKTRKRKAKANISDQPKRS